ncbi:hypothetical protein K3495_g11284 [Podosphaera aphanis]|nr:hypothetical protein K3495_g11284 [Podosphaera aphanis]
MFRTPRESFTSSSKVSLKPSVGRPPTPPKNARSTATVGSKNPLELRPNIKNSIAQSRKMPATTRKPSGKITNKSNASILNFFKKVDSPMKDDPIFVSDTSQPFCTPLRPRSRTENLDVTLEILCQDEDEDTFESLRSVKRRKIESELMSTDRNLSHDADIVSKKAQSKSKNILQNKSKPRRKGPFLSDSDTDDDDEPESHQMASGPISNVNMDPAPRSNQSLSPNSTAQLTGIKLDEPLIRELYDVPAEASLETEDEVSLKKPSPKRKNSISSNLLEQEDKITNIITHSNLSEPSPKKSSPLMDEWGDFDNAEFEDDDFLDGEEFIGRQFMQEQALLEIADGDDENQDGLDGDSQQSPNPTIISVCPICNVSLTGNSAEMASRHVNGCLDSNAVKYDPEITNIKYPQSKPEKKPVRKNALPRPGQTNPFDLVVADSGPVTAFSKLMTGKAEDAAWTNAASSERSSKGKPAYQRTCPFYKIIPGFSICVDAFRYGAVQGCVAYFLSHFHSDHYIGLTSSWSNGPIYCSKVTANLVKQQLRVDPKYVVPLEFEKNYEVPDTPGVTVSMISANHCPGSSLFLFEKKIIKGPPARIQRILHCGDFRACPAHVTHPLLMPDVVDSVTGNLKQQKIDVCYLDTTYLNSRYAFPPQKQVIQACADMCLSLKKERAEEDDAWETSKRERAVSKYFNSGVVKPEAPSIAPFCGSDKTRGRLLVVCGTYSIGKELICLGIARALNCKIFAPARKMRICAALEDEELMSRMTSDPREAQIHMQMLMEIRPETLQEYLNSYKPHFSRVMLMEIRPETLQEYLNSYKPHFSRVVGFRPSGWTYKPPSSRAIQSATVPQILTSPSWRSSFSLSDLTPQRGSTREASCFGVPYSEHSSFRELALFVCALRIEKIIPTVNIGSAPGRAKMQAWIEKWQAERRKNGPIKIGDEENQVQW